MMIVFLVIIVIAFGFMGLYPQQNLIHSNQNQN